MNIVKEKKKKKKKKKKEKTYSTHGLKIGRSLVFEVVRVLDLSWGPGSLVRGVIDHGGRPFTLELWVLHHGLSPRATTGDLGALGVGDSWGNPVTILLIVPVLWLLSLGIGNGGGLVLEPVLGLGGLLVHNFVGGVLIPVLRLLSIRVGNASLINPVFGLRIGRIVNLLGGVDGGLEVSKETARLDLFAVLLDNIGVVRVDNERVEFRGLDDLGSGRGDQVLLLVLASLGILMVENEVDLVSVATLVRAKHDDVWRGVGELLLM